MKTLNYKFSNNEELELFIENDLKIDDGTDLLVQVFTGVCDRVFISNLVLSIKKLLPKVKIIGSTTSGEMIDCSVDTNSTVISFTLFEHTRVVTHSQTTLSSSYDTASALINKFDKEGRAKVAISFSDGLNTNGETYLNAFYEYDKNLVVAGGLAGDNAIFKATIVFTEDHILSNGCVVALLYNDDLVVNTKAVFGWESIGKILTITKVEGNVVYEIDGIKPVDIYAKYLGDDIALELPRTGIEFPLIIKRDGLPIPRAVVGKNDDGSLIFAGSLSEGDKVTFGYGNVEAIINDGITLHKEVLKNPIESIFIYSCMARKALMGDSIALELKILSSVVPLSGFFTYGEFFSSLQTGNNELLNQTMTILSLSENPNKKEFLERNLNLKDRRENKTLKAFSHLISQTTKELEDINSSLSQRVEEEILKNRIQDRQLLEQSRLAQMGEMISMIAHQWRQPLAAISASSAILELKSTLGTIEPQTIIDTAKDISSYSQHLSETINDFRDFFKEEKNQKITSFEMVMYAVLSIIKVSIENKNILLIEELNTTRKFKTYPNELKQVVLNLIKNAEDILLEKKVDQPYIKVKTYSEGDFEILEVYDNAGGVPLDIIDKIFDPYYSTKLEKNGTGLGLYMSKTIIHEHCKGVLSVSNDNEGAVFKIKLPI
jgi:signal transduction histidine kinase